MNRHTLLALGVLILAGGCMDTPRDKPLARTPSLYKRLGGAPAIDRIADAFTDQMLLADDVGKGRKEQLLGSEKNATHKKLVAQLTALTQGSQLLGDGPLPWSIKDADSAAVKDALQRALKACKVIPRDEADLLKALEPPPA